MIRNLIFLLNSPYPDYTGGRETWIYNVCNKLVKYYNITIVSQEKEENSGEMGQFVNIDPRIEIVRVPTLSSQNKYAWLVRSYMRFVNKILLADKMVKKVLSLVEPTQKYVVISMDTVFMAYAGRKIGKKCQNVVHVASSRGPHAEIYSADYPMLGNLIKKMEIKNFVSADCIWANGSDTQKGISDKGFQSILIKNGVNIKKAFETQPIDLHHLFDIPKEGKILVTVGTLQDIKGYREIIRALQILKERYQIEVHLVGVGKGDAEEYLQLARRLGVEELVHFPGVKENAVIFTKSADVIACLSGGGGLGMACLEAMASNKPIVAWNTDVYTQMIREKENGLLVKEGDENSLAEGVKYILDNYKECLEWAEQAADDVKKYDWDCVVNDIIHSIVEMEVVE